jgi:hypothetical protein
MKVVECPNCGLPHECDEEYDATQIPEWCLCNDDQDGGEVRDSDQCIDCTKWGSGPVCDECFEKRIVTHKDLVVVECPACPARFIDAGKRDRLWAHMIEEEHVPKGWTVPMRFRLKAERFAVGGPVNE